MLVIVVLYWAQAVLVPIALAILLSFVLAPPVTWLERWLGRVPAVLVVVTLVFVVLGLAGWGLARQMDHLANDLPAYRVNIRAKIDDVRGAGKGGTVEKLQETIEEIKTDLGKADAPKGRTPQQVMVAAGAGGGLPGFAWLGPIVGPLGTAGLVVALVIFMLLERRDLRDRLIGADRTRPPDRDDQGVRRSGHARQQAAVDAVARQRHLRRGRRTGPVLSRRAVPAGVGHARRGASLRPVPWSRARRRRADPRQPRRAPGLDRPAVR